MKRSNTTPIHGRDESKQWTSTDKTILSAQLRNDISSLLADLLLLDLQSHIVFTVNSPSQTNRKLALTPSTES